MARQTFVTPCPCLVTHLIKDRWPLACAVPPAPGALGTQLGPPNASVQGLQQSTHPGRDSLTDVDLVPLLSPKPTSEDTVEGVSSIA